MQTYDTYLFFISNTVVWHYVIGKVLLAVRSRLNLLHFLHWLAEMLRDDWMKENTNVSYSNGAASRRRRRVCRAAHTNPWKRGVRPDELSLGK